MKKPFEMDIADSNYGAVSKIENGYSKKVLINKEELLEVLDLENFDPGNGGGHIPTISISKDETWVIDGVDTGISARGKDGKTPTIVIGENETWVINGVDTEMPARGRDGKDGKDGVDGKDGKDIDATNHYTKTETDSLLEDKMPLISEPIDGMIAVIKYDGTVISGDKAIDDLTSEASNILIDSSAFSKNLTKNEDTLQKALERVDKFSFTDFQIANWKSGGDYLAGDIRIHNNTFVRAKVNTSSIEFNSTTEWETISGIMQFDTIDKLPPEGNVGVFYVVVSDSTNNDEPKGYIWSPAIADYVAVTSGGSSTVTESNRVMVSPTDKSDGYLESKISGDKYILARNIADTDDAETLQLSLADTVFRTDVKTTDDIQEGLVNKYYVKNEALDSVGSMLKNTTTIGLSYSNIDKRVEATVIPNMTVQKLEIAKNSDLKGTRKRINFVEGVGIKVDATDNVLGDAIDITIKSEAEINTASNVGTEGIGIFLKKDVYDLQFKKLTSVNGKLLIEDDGVNDVVKFTIDDSKLSIDASQINGLTEAISNDQSMTSLLEDQHKHTNSTVLSGLEDVDGHLSYNGNYVGDMVMDAFDADKDGIVDIAVTLVDLNVGVGTLNLLQGATSNIQAQLNALSKGLHYEGSVATYADLIATPNPTDGAFVIVLTDETHFGGRSQYIYSESKDIWEYSGTFDSTSRDFTINPIKLGSEVTGILVDAKIDPVIARKTDIPQFANKTLLGNLSDINGVLNYLGSPIFDKSMVIDDAYILNTKTWSSYKIYQETGRVGQKFINETNRGNNRFLIYDQLTDKLKYTKMFIPDWEQLTNYEKGHVVWADNAARRCRSNHTSGILFNNDIDNWDSFGSGGGGGTAILREISGVATVGAGDSVFLHLSTGYNKYDIRSVYATSMISEDIVIEIYNQTNSGTILYQSLESPIIQDIVNAPCEDKDYTKCIHVKFFNRGSLPADIKYLIYITSLS